MMNTTKLLRQIMILAIFALVAVAAAGAEAGGERYIVILKSRSGPAPDVARLGGTINFRQQDQVNVTLPRESLAALRADPLVLYVQAVAGADDAPLIGEPDEPTPGAPRRLVPHATAGNQSWSRSYTYDDAGNITNIGSQEFVYDALGRLKEMATSGTTTEQYGYDRYGNQTSRTSGGVLQQIPTEPTTNQLSTGYTYDPAGNLKTGDGYTLTYDALGQAATKIYTAANTFNETYIYTAGEERLGVLTSNTAESSSWWYWSVRDEGGKVLRQYRSAASDPTQTALWIEDYVYRDGLLLGAERPPTMGGRRHFHLDHLGSPRLITSNDGQIVSMHDYLPFGGETTSVFQEEYGGFDREDPMKFTGHERDYAGSFGREDGHVIDYMHARYYNPTAGRFLSPDPLDGLQSFPQSWNRYAYARNNPLKYIDPTGKYVWAACTGSDQQCQADRTAFEQARQNDLGSSDAAVRNAAAAYGDPGQANGVTVAFGTPAPGSAGETRAFPQGHENGTVSLTANVLIQSGLSGLSLNAVVGHEGQHVSDAQGFIATFASDPSKQGGVTWDPSKNLTNLQTETNAYHITQSILASSRQSASFGCSTCVLGVAARTPADVNLAITRILTNPTGPYAATLNNRQMTGWDTPPQAATPNP
jgi:RHS repeat-associated protein